MTRDTSGVLTYAEQRERIAELEAALKEVLDMRTVGEPSAYYYARDVMVIVDKALRKSDS